MYHTSIDAHYFANDYLKNGNKKSLIITATGLQAQKLAQEITFFNPQCHVAVFNDSEILPYDTLSPQQSIIAKRLKVLYQWLNGHVDILITAGTTILEKLPPVTWLLQSMLQLEVKQKCNTAILTQQLQSSGYQLVEQVMSTGEYAIRGSLLDLFPLGSLHPYRIDFFDDEVDSIRSFDEQTQKTITLVNQINICPAKFFPTDEVSLKRFIEHYKNMFPKSKEKKQFITDFVINGLKGVFPTGIESYAPLFLENQQTVSFIDYVTYVINEFNEFNEFNIVDNNVKKTKNNPDNKNNKGIQDLKNRCNLYFYGNVENSLNIHWEQLMKREQMLENSHAVLPLKQLLFSPQELFELMKQKSLLKRDLWQKNEVFQQENYQTIYQYLLSNQDKTEERTKQKTIKESVEKPLFSVKDVQNIKNFSSWLKEQEKLNHKKNVPILLVADSLGRQQTLQRVFQEQGLTIPVIHQFDEIKNNSIAMIQAPLHEGFISQNLYCFTENDWHIQTDWLEKLEKLEKAKQSASLELSELSESSESSELSHDGYFASLHAERLKALQKKRIQKFYEEALSKQQANNNEDNNKNNQHSSYSNDENLEKNSTTNFNNQESVASATSATLDTLIRDLSEIKEGDFLVHWQHGIGQYLGLEKIDLTIDPKDGQQEMIVLAYAQAQKLYVPITQIEQLNRFPNPLGDLELHELGSKRWKKAREKALVKIYDTASELLELYANRSIQVGHDFTISEQQQQEWQELYENFEQGFGYELTIDQAVAIEQVFTDMQSAKPMDRLVCGDVGFGKTEVALRAILLALYQGKQVAILTPTTLLTEQHYETCLKRLQNLPNFPFNIAEISRFKTEKECNIILKGLADSTIDLVIGTHKLLNASFKNLGLLIVDEEHRFGVRQKEKLKSLKNNVDILTLTATPIPRTLGMAMEGLRDMSVIATPPAKRLPIKTIMATEEKGLIREAILRELRRGGQVFFLHNEVATIDIRQEQLSDLVPEAKIITAHGQMAEKELEQVMRDFMHQRYNVLLCSTIIETGIDVANANTMLIHRSDKLGMAQLHQLRGRVGRSNQQAFCYLLTSGNISASAKQRLEALQASEALGAGFQLAMNDLEIRGAGEILGESQSGSHLQQIGLGLYSELLNRTIKTMQEHYTQQEKNQNNNNNNNANVLIKNISQETLNQQLMSSEALDIRVYAPALLPDEYCHDIQKRLSIYQQLARCQTREQWSEIQEQVINRYGLLPIEAQTLFHLHELRILIEERSRNKIKRIDIRPHLIELHFADSKNSVNSINSFDINPCFNMAKIMEQCQKNQKVWKISPQKLTIIHEEKDVLKRINWFYHWCLNYYC